MANKSERMIPLATLMNIAREKIRRASASSVDTVARFWYSLLEELGAEQEAEELFEYHKSIWS